MYVLKSKHSYISYPNSNVSLTSDIKWAITFSTIELAEAFIFVHNILDIFKVVKI